MSRTTYRFTLGADGRVDILIYSEQPTKDLQCLLSAMADGVRAVGGTASVVEETETERPL